MRDSSQVAVRDLNYEWRRVAEPDHDEERRARATMADPFDFSDAAHSAPTEYANQPGPAERPIEVAGPPIRWLLGAAAVAATAIALAALFEQNGPATILPWVLAGPVAMSILTAFTVFDTRARTRALYASNGLVRVLYVIALALIAVAVVLSAVCIAFWLGRS